MLRAMALICADAVPPIWTGSTTPLASVLQVSVMLPPAVAAQACAATSAYPMAGTLSPFDSYTVLLS